MKPEKSATMQPTVMRAWQKTSAQSSEQNHLIPHDVEQTQNPAGKGRRQRLNMSNIYIPNVCQLKHDVISGYTFALKDGLVELTQPYHSPLPGDCEETILRRTKKDAALTRQQILTAAEQLFLSNGYENTTLEEIALSVGMTRGAVHWHFKNKQGLLFALRDEVRKPLSNLAGDMMSGQKQEPLVSLGGFVETLFFTLHSDKRQKGLVRVMMHLDTAATGSTGKETFHQALLQSITDIFSAADKFNKLPAPWTPDTAAALVTATISGLVTLWASEQDTFELVPDGQNYIRMILQNWQA